MQTVTLQNIHKQYRGHSVLTGLSLDISDNEIFGLIGLNGSGKTSLLKCVLDLHELNAGHIQIFNCSHKQKQARKDLVYLPEKFSPPEYMSGSEYLKWVADSHRLGLNSADFTARVKELLPKVDLDNSALGKLVKDYSKGMMQKLGIVGCLLSGKRLLIMDEPMSGLDPKARALFKNIVKELKQAGKTVFLCTHILADIEQLCDKIGILHQGQLLFVGSPQACCTHYQATTLEQAFLNSINVDS